MDIETAVKARDEIAAFLSAKLMKRTATARVAIGIAIDDTGFKVAIRTPSEEDLYRALGQREAEIREIADYEIDIQITGQIIGGQLADTLVPATTTSTTRLGIGASIGRPDFSAGTLGFFAQRLWDGAIGFVSSNSVLANCDRGKGGDVILHPSPFDRGNGSKDVVADLVAGYPRLRKNGVIVDAAFARLRDGVEYDSSHIGPDMQLQPLPVPLYQQRQVAKLGRSSGLTYGRITALALMNLDIDYPSLGARITFDRQIEIKSDDSIPFIKPGDSGSLVINPDGHPIGLLFAGNRDGSYSYASPIDDVLRELGIRMLS